MPTMVVMRGLPGSGKSTLAQNIAKRRNAALCSADDWFIRNGKYCFDPKQLGVAHMRCQHYVREACKAGRDVVVDNTNASWGEVKVWVDIAKEFGYKLAVSVPSWTEDLFCDGSWNLKFLSGRSVHDVPDEVLSGISERFVWGVEDMIRESGVEIEDVC